MKRSIALVAAVALAAALATAAPAGAAPGDSISGVVTSDADGTPIAGIRISLNDVDDGGYVAETKTAADGTYTFDDVAPGPYRLKFVDRSDTYVDEWHSDSPNAASAMVITHTSGETVVDEALMPMMVPPPATCAPLGPWATWMPPMTWTSAQIEDAQSLVCQAITLAPGLDTPAEAAAAGFRSIDDGALTGYEHWIHTGRMGDSQEMNLNTVESVVFKINPDGSRTLAAFMPILTNGSTFDDIPPEWAYIPGWHLHDDLCFGPDLTVDAIADADGNCPNGTQLVVTPPMMHIWVAPNECDDPFAGVDQNGVSCEAHQH